MKYELREWYYSRNTGNYTEDKTECHVCDMSAERAEKSMALLEAIGCTHYETSKAHFYERQINARRFTQYIFYK